MAWRDCETCEGYGTVPDPNRHWWQFFKTIPCEGCGGDGKSKPPGWPSKSEMKRLKPPPPPAPPRVPCCKCGRDYCRGNG